MKTASFVDIVLKHEDSFNDPADILNLYRNMYFNKPDLIENKIVADALNMVLPELARLRKEHNEQ